MGAQHPVIPLHDWRSPAWPAAPAGEAVADAADAAVWTDQRGRPLRDLRISVTDRCNFRCGYCMPKQVYGRDHRFLPHPQLLSFEEITRVARLFVARGVRKLRLTGGEPLLRRELEALVAQLAALRTPDGQALDLTLTTNGALLGRKAAALAAAGLQRVTVSLDALDDAVFRRMNDVDFPVDQVLASLDAALAAGLRPLKINMVVKRSTNAHEIVPLARHVRDRYGAQASLRFIEYMDVGSSNGWCMDEVLPSDAVLALLQAHWPLQPVPADGDGSETAQRWRYADGRGEIGLISSVSRAFCSSCTRARLSTDGRLYACLFAAQGHDLRALLRGGAGDAQIDATLGRWWAARDDRYSELRMAPQAAGQDRPPRVEMSYIGG